MKAQGDDLGNKGFALVVTLSLMILLAVIAMGLLALSSLSLRSASQGEAMATARSNARLALMLAIGDLQKSLGPDRAVSASSEILATMPAKPRTTGVWESWWDFNPGGGSLDYGAEKQKRFQRWLVSYTDPAALESRSFATTGWTGKTIELVGDKALGGKAESSAKVTAGVVPVYRDGKAWSAYAWHVADEAQKARINLYRDPARNTTVAQKRALLAGQRPDPSVVKYPTGEMLDCLPTDLDPAAFDKATSISGKIIDLDQVELLDQGNRRIKSLRNDVTPYSLGLLTDVRRGALKQDLSCVFELDTSLPGEFAKKKLYASTHGLTGASDPWWSALSGYYNIFRNINNRETGPTFTQAPKADVTLTTLAPPADFYPGPVIAKIETLFSFVTRESHGMWTPLLRAQDPKLLYMGHLVYTPLITLHNPYNISISFDRLDVNIRNVPLAFRFYVNGLPQNSEMVPLSECYWNNDQKRDMVFVIKIGNWSSYDPDSTATDGPIIMKPGQTMICGIYVDPNMIFNDGDGDFVVRDRDLTGNIPFKGKPGYNGRCIGVDLDVLSPSKYDVPPAVSSDKVFKVLGLRASDRVYMEYAMQKPTYDPNVEFKVSATLTVNKTTLNYGGLSFKYKDDTTLKTLFPKTYRYPVTGEMPALDAYVSNTVTPDAYISQHARAKSVAIFSAYARTTNGGVYETGLRTEKSGSVNSLLDGRLAGKPYLFHNPARTVIAVDFSKSKPCTQSHELNFQSLPGSVDDLFEINGVRVNGLTANTAAKGIKSGSYLELPTGPLQTIADFRRSNALTSSYLPAFVQPVGNSQVSPLMSTNKVIQQDKSVSDADLLDHSVLANHALYDRFYFSTFATRGSETPEVVFEQFMNGGAPLASQGFQPYLPAGKTAASAKADLFASGKPTSTAYQKAAEYQLVRGPFNVNSTSVQAWKAVLGALKKSEIVTLWARNAVLETKKTEGVPIPGMSLINGGIMGGPVDSAKIDNSRTNEWNGCRELNHDELESLAGKIVDEVRVRGPFLSMSEFVNRQVGVESKLSLSGALASAIDQSKINDKYFTTQVPVTADDLNNAVLYNYKTPAASLGNPAAGAPGWISQGDLLRILEPAATVRGDTFVIRVCGEAWDVSGKVSARAYAEAVVQRIPEYLDPVDRPALNACTDPTAAKVNKTFGRRMILVSFRWLSSDEI